MRRRSRRNHRKRRANSEIELNVAAMLDMAFQLLAFFILTFKPAPTESQISMRLPDAKPVTKLEQRSDSSSELGAIDEMALALSVSIVALGDGEIDKISIGAKEIASSNPEDLLSGFGATLAELIALGCDSISLRVDDKLRYERLMQIVDVCTKQKLPSGEQFSKVSISPLGAN